MRIRNWGIAGIYKITNKLNGKCYIGKSSDIMSRWTAHKTPKNAKRYKLSYDIQKYGEENFVLQILHICRTEIEFYKEIFFYERHFMSMFEPEYNIAFGSGNGNTRGLSLDDDDYCIKARTTWDGDLKRFRDNYNTLEKYINHYHPQATTPLIESLGG